MGFPEPRHSMVKLFPPFNPFPILQTLNVLKWEELTTSKTEFPKIKQPNPLVNAAHFADPPCTVCTGRGNLIGKRVSYIIEEAEHSQCPTPLS